MEFLNIRTSHFCLRIGIDQVSPNKEPKFFCSVCCFTFLWHKCKSSCFVFFCKTAKLGYFIFCFSCLFHRTMINISSDVPLNIYFLINYLDLITNILKLFPVTYISCKIYILYPEVTIESEPRHQKTSFLHMRKRGRRSARLLIRPLYFLNPKFQASSHLLWLNSPVYVEPGRIPGFLVTRLE